MCHHVTDDDARSKWFTSWDSAVATLQLLQLLYEGDKYNAHVFQMVANSKYELSKLDNGRERDTEAHL